MNWKLVHRRIRVVWLTAGVVFLGWLVWSAQAHGVPDEALKSSRMVRVVALDDATLFRPAAPRVGPLVVLLPGGAVDPTAYAPVARAVAEAGWVVALVRLPWRMAFTEGAQEDVWKRVVAVRDASGVSGPVALGGHSRGAALSARFAGEHAADLAGLFLIGTTHPKAVNLSSLTMPVLKVSGTRDCVADENASLANRSLLPDHTTWVSIVGANHAQFAYYGAQLGDCWATITRESPIWTSAFAMVPSGRRVRLFSTAPKAFSMNARKARPLATTR